MCIINNFSKPEEVSSINGSYKIKKIISSGIIVKVNNANILVRTKIHFRLNDLIQISGKVEKPTNFSDFNYVGYLKTKHIFYMIKFPNIKLLERSNDIRSVVREYLSSGPKEYREIAPLILLGDKTMESKPFYDLSIRLSVVHLFVISGFHISLFNIIFVKLLKLVKLNEKISGYVSIIFIFIYLFLLNFSISATRAAFLVVFMFLNKHYLKNRFSSLQILAFIMIIFCIYHPWIITSLSFIFTFIATGTILFINTLKFKNNFLKYVVILISVYISTLFISININGYLSLFGIFFGILLTPIFSFLFIISIILFPFKEIMANIYWYFEQVIYMLNSVNVLIYISGFSKEIAKSIYLILFSLFIILKIWNLSFDKKIFNSQISN